MILKILLPSEPPVFIDFYGSATGFKGLALKITSRSWGWDFK